MRIIGLWNPDHLSKQTSLIATIDPNIVALLNDTTTNYGLFSAHAVSNNYWSWAFINFNNRNWLRVNCQTSVSLTANLVICQPTSSSSYPALRAAGTRYVYHGCRIYVVACKAGGTVLMVNTTGVQTAAAATEYFVEVVEDLSNNTRKVYVNGTQVSTDTNGNVSVGSTTGSLLNAVTHGYYITDYYFAASEASDVSPPARLGKISVKTLPPTGLTGGDRFSVVGSQSTVPAELGAGRAAVAPTGITSYVTSDSNGGVATLLFTAPNKGDVIMGAMARVFAMKEVAAQAQAYADVGTGRTTTPAQLNTVTALLTPTSIPLALPTGGWSETALGNATVKIWSERT
jgi:hypothetical protein